MSLELWLFAAVTEAIVIGTFFGGAFMAYRVGQRQSAAAAKPRESRIAVVPRQGDSWSASTEREDRSAPAA